MYEFIHKPKEIVLLVKDKDDNILWTPFAFTNVKIEQNFYAFPVVRVEGEIMGNLKRIERIQPFDLSEDELMQMFAEA